MKDLNASVSGETPKLLGDVYAFLSDVEAYPQWYPDGVKRVELRGPDKAFFVLALNQGPIQRDFDMEIAIERVPEKAITLRRLPKRDDDKEQLSVAWLLAPAEHIGTKVTAVFSARLSIPAWLPLGGIEQAIPQGFLDAALARLNA